MSHPLGSFFASLPHKYSYLKNIFLLLWSKKTPKTNIKTKSMATRKKQEDIEQSINRVQEDMRAPLIAQTNTRVTEEQAENGCYENKQDRYMVYLSTFVAVCGSFAFGSCVGYTSPTQSAIREDLNLSIAEYSLFGSIVTLGAMTGAITCGPIADYIGRKGAMRTSSAFCIAGWLAISYAQGALSLDIGRFATGYGMGVFSYVVPVFIAEIAPTDLRGALASLSQLMIATGISVSFIIGTMLTWRALALIGLVPCVILLFGLFIIPESPRWLAKKGHQKEFEIALRRLRGKDADISEEAAEIQDYIKTLEKLPKANLFDLFQRRYLRSVIVGVGLMAFHQFGGLSAIVFYTGSIFESAGFPSNIGTIIFSLVKLFVTAVAVPLIDRVGRKPLLLVSAAGVVIGCVLTGISFYLKGHEIAIKAAPILAVIGILVYIGFFAVGMAAVPWVVMSEIFPINVKGAAGSLTTLVNWSGAWACSYTFNFLMTWNSFGTFILYAAVNALSILFVIKIVPETKGRTLEQIQATINAS